MARTGMELHYEAMLRPITPEERTMVALYRELDALSQRYRNDEQAKDAILHLGSAIIALINQDLGRLQGGAIDQKVRETVQEAGFDASNL